MSSRSARAMPQVAAAVGPRGVALGRGTTVVPLTPLAGVAEVAMPLARRIDELAPGRQIYLAFDGLRAKARPSVLYGLYVDMFEGATPAGTSDPHFVGLLAFPEEAVGSDPAFCGSLNRPAYNITEALRRLNADKLLGATANALTIAPLGKPAGHAAPTIGQIAVVEV